MNLMLISPMCLKTGATPEHVLIELYNEFPSTGLPILQASQVAALCVIETGLFKTVAVMP